MSDILPQLREVLGPNGFLEGDEALARVSRVGLSGETEPSGGFAVLRPKSTEEVSKCLSLCHQAGRPIVAQGGRTGLVQGTTAGGEDLVLSLERMTAIEDVDPIGRTMTLQAGVPLQAAQEKVEEYELMFPLDLGARGSATIGGNVSTNAGGNRVIRYGMMRDMVLGVEAVLADGTVLSSLNRMIKNNAGYDLKQLFIGTEGTLGVVTRVVLRLRELARSQNTAFVAVQSFDQLAAFLKQIDRSLGGSLSAFEVMWNSFYRLITTPPATNRPPLPQDYPYYVLVETMGGDQQTDLERFEQALMQTIEDGLIADAVIAKSQAERDAMWALRDDVGQVGQFGAFFVFDVSLAIKDMEGYVDEVLKRLSDRFPDHRTVVFGHMGDGNLHIVSGVGDGSHEARRGVEEAIYQPLEPLGGSISAEHGIGLEKKAYLPLTRSEPEIALMRMLKKSLDPKGILNPGKIFNV